MWERLCWRVSWWGLLLTWDEFRVLIVLSSELANSGQPEKHRIQAPIPRKVSVLYWHAASFLQRYLSLPLCLPSSFITEPSQITCSPASYSTPLSSTSWDKAQNQVADPFVCEFTVNMKTCPPRTKNKASSLTRGTENHTSLFVNKFCELA